MAYAPIVLFGYNRPTHLRKTLDALKADPLSAQSDIYIYFDGPKKDVSPAGLGDIQATREVAKFADFFKSSTHVFREENWGLAKSIIYGVTEACNKFGKVIVVEDDIVVSTGFLRFMNDALEMYEHDEKVMHISGYNYPIPGYRSIHETAFLRLVTCWGWATWYRAWMHFREDAEQLYRDVKDSNKLARFNLDPDISTFSAQMEANIDGRIKTWAIKWYASVLLLDGLCLHPRKSLVQNIGTDGTGINSMETDAFSISELQQSIKLKKIRLRESEFTLQAVKIFLKTLVPYREESAKSKLAWVKLQLKYLFS